MLILILMPVTCFYKKLERRHTETGKVVQKNHLVEHVSGLIRLISNMIRLKTSIPVRLINYGGKMRRDSPVCERLCG